MKLVRLPEKLGDYVILHELLHTRIKNHGKKFWQELDKIAKFKGRSRVLKFNGNQIT